LGFLGCAGAYGRLIDEAREAAAVNEAIRSCSCRRWRMSDADIFAAALAVVGFATGLATAWLIVLLRQRPDHWNRWR
jgi:hypothetical protein